MEEGYEIGRRIIVVVPDKAAEAILEVQKEPPQTPDSFAVRIAKAVGALYTEPYAITLGKQAIEMIKEIMKALEKGADLTTLSYSETKRMSLIFPPGHPRERIVYAQHPASQQLYYTASSFHRQAFEHKFAEVITLLSSLGANEINVEHISGWNQDFSAKLGFTAPTKDGVAAQGGKAASDNSSALFRAKLAGHDSPAIPENLVWFPHEPIWQAVASSRINSGLKDFNLSLAYSDDYGINASFNASIKDSGLELGGKFEEHQSTIWKITGTFGSVSP